MERKDPGDLLMSFQTATEAGLQENPEDEAALSKSSLKVEPVFGFITQAVFDCFLFLPLKQETRRPDCGRSASPAPPPHSLLPHKAPNASRRSV